MLLRNNKRNDRKGGKFSYVWLGPYIVEDIIPKGVATLKNSSNGLVLKKKYNRAQLKRYIVSDEKPTIASEQNPVVSDEKHIDSEENPIASDEKPAVTNQWLRLPNEMWEMILRWAIESSRYNYQRHICEMYQTLISTCKRPRIITESIAKDILPRIYLCDTTDKMTGLTYNGKINLSVRNITATFGVSSGVAENISRIIGKNWKCAWLILSPEQMSWFTVEKVYWKTTKRGINVEEHPISKTWIKNRHYHLTEQDKNILQEDGWLNDNLMDAAQKLICKVIGYIDSYQSVLNSQKDSTYYTVCNNEHLQLLHDGKNHWLLSCNSNGRVQVR